MNLSVIGSGYVGTTIAACFADFEHDAVNVNIDEKTVETINNGNAPIHEEGLAELVANHAGSNRTRRPRATTDYEVVLDTDATSAVF